MLGLIERPKILFVYGTLKRDCSNHSVITANGGKFIEKDSVTGFCLWDLINYPAAVRSKSAVAYVYGETYEVNENVMKHVDLLEGVAHGNFYKTRVLTDRKQDAWIYAKELPENRKFYERILGGFWYQDGRYSTALQELHNEQAVPNTSNRGFACETPLQPAVPVAPPVVRVSPVELCWGPKHWVIPVVRSKVA